MMVVAVLITSCQVSEKWKIGPKTAQITIASRAIRKAHEVPTALQSHCAQARNFPCNPEQAPFGCADGEAGFDAFMLN